MVLLQEVAELAGAAGVAELAEGFGLDLPDALARDAEVAPDLFEGAAAPVVQAEAELQDPALALAERAERALDLLAEELERRRPRRAGALRSSMKSPRWESSSSPMGVSSETGSWETLRISRTRSGETSMPSAISCGGGLASVLLDEPAAYAHELVDGLDHVNGDADGAGLIGDGASDGLPDPPGGVGGELVALAVVELLNGADKADVALLDEVEEGHAAADVLLGDAYDEAEVRFREVALRLDAQFLDVPEVPVEDELVALEVLPDVGVLDDLREVGDGDVGADDARGCRPAARGC